MTVEDRKLEKPAADRGVESDQGAAGSVAGRAASISPEAGKNNEASPGAEADRKRVEKH